MAHVFDGTWTSTIIEDSGPSRDLPFQIEVDPANGQLRPSSAHGGRPVTGAATSSRIKIIQTFPELPGVSVQYDGSLCGELIVSGVIRSIICGVLTVRTPGLVPDDLESIKGFEALRPLMSETNFGQEQEIWIATKP